MNTQNILKYYGSKLDFKLDSSEFYDYELAKVDLDYNVDVLDLTTPITYTSLKIDDSLENFECVRSTITLVEYDNRINNPSYIYSGFSTTIDFEDFTEEIYPNHKYVILNNDVYLFKDLNDNIHYMEVKGYNNPINVDPNMNGGFIDEYFYYKCNGKLEKSTACCGITPKYGVKPWAYQFIQPEPNECITPIIEKRTEKGWTLDFVFNRESQPWSSGGKFYFFGTGGLGSVSNIADSAFSLGFTSDGRIEWVATRYSGYCDTVSGYTDGYYTESDTTPILCTTGETKDFNITVVFERYNRYVGCELENEGGVNDLLGWRVDEYEDLEVTAVTSTQIATYDETTQLLNKKWANERYKRLGTLKIYLNGRPIYKKEKWEEVIPSQRGSLPYIQSWGGSQQFDLNHRGVCCFNVKSIKYYEEPLDFVHVRHNFLTRINDYDFFICGEDCEDDIFEINDGHIIVNDEIILLGDDDTHLIYNG